MTNLLVLGGTGFTGSNVAREAVHRGYSVTSLSRKPPTSPIAGVEYEYGSALDAHKLISQADVIVGAVSPRAGSEGALLEIYSTVGQAAADSGARLLVVGGFSSLRPAEGEPRYFDTGHVTPAFAVEAGEVTSVRRWLENDAPSNLSWVFVTPAHKYGPHLPQEDPRGEYRTSTDVALYDQAGVSAIGGIDFALAILDEISNPSRHRSQVHYAY